MYRLLNYASNMNITKQNKAMKNKQKFNDNDLSDSSDPNWRKKMTNNKTDLANIEKYRTFDNY